MTNPPRDYDSMPSSFLLSCAILMLVGALIGIGGFMGGTLTTRLATAQSKPDATQAVPVDDEALEARIKRLVGAAMEAAGTDDAALDRRVRASIRKIAKSSAQKAGQARAVPDSDSDSKQLGTPVSRVRSVDSDRDHILGDLDAPVSLIVYDDLECPFCKRHQSTLKEIAERYDGRVNVVLRHMPLGMHNPVAQNEALMSKCVAREAGNNTFWQFVDAVFAQSGGNGRGLSRAGMDEVLTGLDLDPQAMRDCVNTHRDELMAEIDADTRDGQVVGVRGTPGNVIINNATGKAVRLNGARPMSHFAPLLDSMLGGA